MAFADLDRLNPGGPTWNVDQLSQAIFDFEYSDECDGLLGLHAKGKKMQWDAAERIDWSQNLDWENPQGMPEDIAAVAAE